ncbi:MAG: hypothetical protein Tsb002_17780 [Wenzhouxiangellaceae bacterium]
MAAAGSAMIAASINTTPICKFDRIIRTPLILDDLHPRISIMTACSYCAARLMRALALDPNPHMGYAIGQIKLYTHVIH